MIELVRTNSENADFAELVRYLDEYLAEKDRVEHSFYDQFNKIQKIKYVVMAYDEKNALGCGAIKEFAAGIMEVKRMYVRPESRGKGIALKILTELEKWATEMNYAKCVLETGKRQPEAIALYQKSGYRLISNYGQYANVENSICFEKSLRSKS